MGCSWHMVNMHDTSTINNNNNDQSQEGCKHEQGSLDAKAENRSEEQDIDGGGGGWRT